MAAANAGNLPDNQVVFQSSALMTRLLLQYTSGTLSAAEVCRIAHAAVVDGCDHPEIYQFASLGSWGTYPANARRAIERLLDVSTLPQPTIVRVPCLDTRSNPAIVMFDDMGIMEPHALSSHVECEQLLWLSSAAAFWDGVSPNFPRFLAKGGHPMLEVQNWRECFIPLWIHGDGVEYSENDSLQVYTAGSCLTSSNSMLTMLYMASFVKSATCVLASHGQDTWDEAWKYVCWSLHALWEGVYPLTDADQQPFPVGSRNHALAGRPLGFRV